MTIAITGGPVSQRRGGAFAAESLSQSTATTFQSVAVSCGLTYVGVGTASGFGVNLYSLASGTEGQDKILAATATGEAKFYGQGSTATGLWVLGALDAWLSLRYFAGAWRIIANNGATLATAT